MVRPMKYKVTDILPHVVGSGGILATIAQRLGCDRRTIRRYIDRHPTLADAVQAEEEAVLDIAESVIVNNIRMVAAKQRQRVEAEDLTPVDTWDVKWYLSRKGARRGYAEKREVTGAEGKDLMPAGKDIIIVEEYLDDEDGPDA